MKKPVAVERAAEMETGKEVAPEKPAAAAQVPKAAKPLGTGPPEKPAVTPLTPKAIKTLEKGTPPEVSHEKVRLRLLNGANASIYNLTFRVPRSVKN